MNFIQTLLLRGIYALSGETTQSEFFLLASEKGLALKGKLTGSYKSLPCQKGGNSTKCIHLP